MVKVTGSSFSFCMLSLIRAIPSTLFHRATLNLAQRYNLGMQSVV